MFKTPAEKLAVPLVPVVVKVIGAWKSLPATAALNPLVPFLTIPDTLGSPTNLGILFISLL